MVGDRDWIIGKELSEEEIKEMEKAIDAIVEMGFPYFISKEDIENNGDIR